MQNILRITNEINNTSSRNEKESILKQNIENNLLKDVLKFVFNPYIITGISSKKIKKKINIQDDYNIKDIIELMDYLRHNNTGKDLDIFRIKTFIENQPLDLQNLYYQIVCKDLKIGITAKTINKIYGKNFIPEFELMLAEKYFDNEDRLVGKFIITLKLDGVRCVIIKENNTIKIFSRQGQLIEGLIDIIEEAKLLPNNYVYDGELLLKNDNNLLSKDLYRETIKITNKDGVKNNLIFNCFDIIPIDEFKEGISKDICIDRKNKLHDILNNLNLKWIQRLPILYIGEDKNKILELLKQYTDTGNEGIMINTANGKYECKRTKELLKVKQMQDVDLKIVGFEEGEGKYKNTLGRINVEYKNNIVGVGSGFSEQMRNEIWNNQENYINKIAKIQYFEESINSKTKILSLRFPVFIEIRNDKIEPSYY